MSSLFSEEELKNCYMNALETAREIKKTEVTLTSAKMCMRDILEESDTATFVNLAIARLERVDKSNRKVTKLLWSLREQEWK